VAAGRRRAATGGGRQPLGYRLEQWDLELAYRPGIQVNAGSTVARRWTGWRRSDERVLDLFCGLGNFALPLARQVREVVAVEGVQAMVERAAANAVSNNLHNAKFFQADLSQPLTDAEWAAKAFLRYSWTHRVTAAEVAQARDSASGWCMCRATRQRWRATRSN
jgi:23S rRNA (uracil1939-C5)-methyltransferase